MFVDPTGLFSENAYPLNNLAGGFATGTVASRPSIIDSSFARPFNSLSNTASLERDFKTDQFLAGLSVNGTSQRVPGAAITSHLQRYGTDPAYRNAVDYPVRADGYGALSGYFKDNEKYYREQGGFGGAIGSIANGILVGPAALFDTVPRAIAEGFADHREQIRRQIDTSDSFIDRTAGRVALGLNYFGEVTAQAGNATGASAPIIATGGASPAVAAVLTNKAVVGGVSALGLLDAVPTAIENYNAGNLSGTDVFYVIGNAIGLGYSLKPTPKTIVPRSHIASDDGVPNGLIRSGVRSETSGAVTNLGTRTVAENSAILARLRPGEGMSAVFDHSSGNLLLRPSSDVFGPLPQGWVRQIGGHADVRADLGLAIGENLTNAARGRLSGFAVVKEADGTVSFRWNSGQINPRSHGSRAVPQPLRPDIEAAVKESLGL